MVEEVKKTFNEMLYEAKLKAEALQASEEAIEKLARKLYETRIPEETYFIMYGKEKPAWRIEGLPWDKFPDLELAEHERDEYRSQAIDLLSDSDLIISIK